jgi:AraC-like DNA-binding protein
MQLFENYLLENTNIKSYKKDNIDEFYEKIMLSKGDTRISSLLNSLNMNPRSFRRHFIRRVGISAKGLLRIVRVNYIWDNFRNNNNLNFYDVVYDCNFFDQAHLINDFKKIVGESPKRFFSRNLKYVESFSGKSFPVT